MNVTLRARVFGGIFDVDQNHEVNIVPHVVNLTDVILEGDVFIIERFTVETYGEREKVDVAIHERQTSLFTAYEARIAKDFIVALFLRT